MKIQFIVSDGKLVLNLLPAKEGGYTVTSPMDPELVTEAETIEEAFVMARDAIKTLNGGQQWDRQIKKDSRDKNSPIARLAAKAAVEHKIGKTKKL